MHFRLTRFDHLSKKTKTGPLRVLFVLSTKWYKRRNLGISTFIFFIFLMLNAWTHPMKNSNEDNDCTAILIVAEVKNESCFLPDYTEQ